MKALVKRISGLAFAGKADSNVWVPMDAPLDTGGTGAGARPLELLLLGLGGCTGMDVVSILQKKRIPLTDFEIELEADRAEEHPRVFTAIRIKYIIYGRGIPEKDVIRAIELSEEKYCSVGAMLRAAAPVTSTFEIREPQP